MTKAACIREWGRTFVNVFCRTRAPIRGVEVVRAAGPGRGTGLPTGGGLSVCVTRVPAVAIAVQREGGAAAVYSIHGLKVRVQGRWWDALMCIDHTNKIPYHQCSLETFHDQDLDVTLNPPGHYKKASGVFVCPLKRATGEANITPDGGSRL